MLCRSLVYWHSRLGAVFIGLALSTNLGARPDRIAAINGICQSIRHEFAESEPRYFSGPNPWVQLDKQPVAFSDLALASVFSEGTRVRWVRLQLSDPDRDWFETTNYFFDEAGLIQKRERHYEQVAANIKIDEATFFAQGKRIKDSYHHSPLSKGKEQLDKLSDPDAPEYRSTGDLPLLFSPNDWNHLALR